MHHTIDALVAKAQKVEWDSIEEYNRLVEMLSVTPGYSRFIPAVKAIISDEIDHANLFNRIFNAISDSKSSRDLAPKYEELTRESEAE